MGGGGNLCVSRVQRSSMPSPVGGRSSKALSARVGSFSHGVTRLCEGLGVGASRGVWGDSMSIRGGGMLGGRGEEGRVWRGALGGLAGAM